jgi:predicted ATP-grasp superfamily ATP-dependent carboligase
MDEQTSTSRPDSGNHWLVAAWPGMGNTSVIAATYMLQKLGAEVALELPATGRFDVHSVEVRAGLVENPRLPRSVFHRVRPQAAGPKLTVFVGEAQPSVGMYEFANLILDQAEKMGVQRIVTFAAMASQLHPSHQPRVYGAATSSELLDELRRLEVAPVQEGQIGGMNGVLLGACAERGVPGMCLMGEMPFFATGVPNPKAAKAVLDAFALMTGLEIDLDELSKHAESVDRALVEMLNRMQAQAGGAQPDEDEPEIAQEPSEEAEAATEPHPAPERRLDYGTRQRIERLFEESRQDRAKAMELKKELDRLGVFKQYEDRFLDLFKQAG